MGSTESGSESLADAVRTHLRTAESLLKLALAAAFSVAWMAFWGNVVRLHYGQGDLTAAAFTGLTLVLPGLVGLAWAVISMQDVVGGTSMAPLRDSAGRGSDQ